MKNKKIWIALIALVAAVSVGVTVFILTRPTGPKKITVTVVKMNGDEKVFHYETEAKTLYEALTAEGLIEADPENPDFILTVDGESIVWEEQEAIWMVFDGETPSENAGEEVVLKNGGSYKIVYTKGDF